MTERDEYEAEVRQRLALAEALRAQQNFPLGVAAGAAMSVTAAVAWAVFAMQSGLHAGVLVVVLGLAVGLAVQFAGRGLELRFMVAAGLLALGGLVLGHVLLIGVLRGTAEELSLFEVLSPSRLADSLRFYLRALGPLDPIYAAVAVGMAAYFSRRRLCKRERRALFASKVRSDR